MPNLLLALKKPEMRPEDFVTLDKVGEAGVRNRLRGSSSDTLFVTHGRFRHVYVKWRLASGKGSLLDKSRRARGYYRADPNVPIWSLLE